MTQVTIFDYTDKKGLIIIIITIITIIINITIITVSFLPSQQRYFRTGGSCFDIAFDFLGAQVLAPIKICTNHKQNSFL